MVLVEECFFFTVYLLNSDAFSTLNGGLCIFGIRMSIFCGFVHLLPSQIFGPQLEILINR